MDSRKELDSHHTSQVMPLTTCTRTRTHPVAVQGLILLFMHVEQQETSGEGRVPELPADPALSLPSPCRSMCLQKEWKLGRLERIAQSRVGKGDELLPFCSVGITPKR